MNEAPRRLDAWVQWALLIITIVGALWNLSARLASIEQQLHDDSQFHADETTRLEKLEEQVNRGVYIAPYANVAH